ncbi:MAG: penicillin acylase family protein, partial [Deltaproteobacteria bacterium]|nr:penicillin acylase family protein [Deltaproteobacteria bacterium]
IYARNEPDLYRAVGWCMAQDRLFQMDLIRRATSGRLSEIFGEQTVKVDHLMRALRIPEKSRLIISKTDAGILQLAEAFCDGVNQYVGSHRDRLPVEFSILRYAPEKWQVEHVFNVVSFMAFDLSTAWSTEIMFHRVLEKVGRERLQEILPDAAGYGRVIYPEFTGKTADIGIDDTLLAGAGMLERIGLTVFSGSNNWVVSGEKSVTGKPILANDMHLGLSSPGIWYQMHQVVEGGGLNVTGVVVPGQPFVTAGHTDRIAWGFTNVMVDDMDFYLEKINPENPNQYEFNGQWKEMQVRREKIGVKGGDVVEKEIRFTHRGPIVSELKELGDTAISMRWTGNAYSNESRTLYLLGKARNWDDFKNAVKTFTSVSQNVVYADVDGNIGLYCAAGIPIREKGAGMAVMPGWTDRYDWKGFVPFEELPHSYNPASGYLCSANNKTVGDAYPYYISAWFVPDYRFRRIEEMLASKKTLSVEDVIAMQADWKSKLVEGMLPDLVAVVSSAGDLTPLERRAASLLADWDGVMTADSGAAALFETFYVSFMRNVFADDLGADLFDEFIAPGFVTSLAVERVWANRSSSWYDRAGTADRRETFTDVVRMSFKDAVAWLEKEMGGNPDKWQWGKIHRLTLAHPLGSVRMLDRIFKLNRGPYAVGGSSHTVSPYMYRYTKPFEVYHGASHRHIYSLADWNASLTIIPTGTCGVPASPYYCDQTNDYLNNQYHHDYVGRDLVEKSAKHVTTLTGK